MTGDRDPETPVSTPNSQYTPVPSTAPTPFSDPAGSPFDPLGTVAEVEVCLVDAAVDLPGSGVESVALFRVDSSRNCLVGRLALRAEPSSVDEEASGLSELSREVRRLRFSIEDTELGPVGAMIAATLGAPVEDPGTAFETEDPAELVKVLGTGPWSYWTLGGVEGPMGVLCVAGTTGEGADALEVLMREAGRALERTEARAEWNRMTRQQRRLREGAVTVCNARNLTELYRRLIRIAARGTSAPWARFLTEEKQQFRVLAQCGAVPETPGFEAALQTEVRPTWETLRSRVWSGSSGEDGLPATGPVWLIPVQAFDQALGVLAIGRLAEELVGEMDRDEPFLASVAAQFGLAIRNSELGEELRVSRQRLREIQGQLLRSERMALIGETAAELAGQARPMASSIYQSVRDLWESMDETDPQAVPVEGLCREMLRLEALLREQVDLEHLTQPRLVMCQFDGLVEKCIGVVRDDARRVGVDLTAQTRPELPELLLDHEKVQSVVVNLLKSALEGLRRGDGLKVETKKSGHHLVLKVTAAARSEEGDSEAVSSIDSGDLLARLFAPFASAQAGGTTLGLAVARQIVVDHGGELDISREGGRSLVYRLRLPIRDNSDRRVGTDRRGRDRRRAA